MVSELEFWKREAIKAKAEVGEMIIQEKLGKVIRLPYEIGKELYRAGAYEEFDGTAWCDVEKVTMVGYLKDGDKVNYIIKYKTGEMDHISEEELTAEVFG